MNEPDPQALPGHSRRCFRHPNRTRRPNTGRPAGSTSLSPFGSHPPPQPGHNGDTGGGRTPGRGAAGGPHRGGLVHIPNPAITSHMRLCLHSTRVLIHSGSVYSVRLWRTPPPNQRIPHLFHPTPPSFPKSRQSPNPHPRPPGKNAKKASPSPRFRGPSPRRLHRRSGRARSVPGGSRSEDDPCPGLRYLRTGGACGTFIIRHRCDMVNTFVTDPGGFFCHSVI